MAARWQTIVPMLRRRALPVGVANIQYLPLAFLGFFWIDALLHPPASSPAWYWWLTVLSSMLFVALYIASFWLRNRKALPLIVATCLLGALWAPYNTGSSAFFIFAGGMCCALDKPQHAYRMLGLVVLVLCLTIWLADKQASFWVPGLVFTVAVGFGRIAAETAVRARIRLMRKQEEVEYLATIAERERISRDLHDLLGHSLSLITLKAELAGKLFERDAQASKQEIADIEQAARHALNEVRAAVVGYRQTGLAHELKTAQAALTAAAVTVSATVDAPPLPAAIENVIALALREAVTNIVRHAQASRCDIVLTAQAGAVHLRIADNGKGAAGLRRGSGLRGMAERVAACGGALQIRNDMGFQLELSLPLGAPA